MQNLHGQRLIIARLLYQTFTGLIEQKSDSEKLTKVGLKNDLDLVYKKVVQKCDKLMKANFKLELSIPEVEEKEVNITQDNPPKKNSKYEIKKLFYNKNTNILFENIDGEYIAFGTLFDDGTGVDKILLLGPLDAIRCIENQWRFNVSRCVNNVCHHMDNPYGYKPT